MVSANWNLLQIALFVFVNWVFVDFVPWRYMIPLLWILSVQSNHPILVPNRWHICLAGVPLSLGCISAPSPWAGWGRPPCSPSPWRTSDSPPSLVAGRWGPECSGRGWPAGPRWATSWQRRGSSSWRLWAGCNWGETPGRSWCPPWPPSPSRESRAPSENVRNKMLGLARDVSVSPSSLPRWWCPVSLSGSHSACTEC